MERQQYHFPRRARQIAAFHGCQRALLLLWHARIQRLLLLLLCGTVRFVAVAAAVAAIGRGGGHAAVRVVERQRRVSDDVVVLEARGEAGYCVSRATLCATDTAATATAATPQRDFRQLQLQQL